MSDRANMRIGQVVKSLVDEFPDVSISKLRFLEEQGLVTPARTPGGYRMYSEEHVRQLRRVMQMQRDEFLPLKVIREELQRRLGAGGTQASRQGDAAASGRISLTAHDEFMTESQLLQLAQVSPDFLDECRAADLIDGQLRADGTTVYSQQQAGLVQIAAQMHRLGVEPRHLRQVRAMVGRQAGLVEQYASARLRTRNPDARATAIRSVEALTQSLADFIRLAFVHDVRTMTARAVASAGEQRSSVGPQAAVITATATPPTR